MENFYPKILFQLIKNWIESWVFNSCMTNTDKFYKTSSAHRSIEEEDISRAVVDLIQ